MELYKELSEKEIAVGVLNGNKSLYEIIVRRFNPYLYKIGRSYNYNHEDTQDLMQDTFIDAYKNLSQYEGRSSFKTWLVRIMLNNCYHKKEKFSYKNEIMKDIDDESKPIFQQANNDTQKIIHNRELGNIIESALANIPEEYRMVFSLREINGFDIAETSDLLSISQANVKVRHCRAKAMLRTEMEKAYTANELFEFHAVYCNKIAANVMLKINALNLY